MPSINSISSKFLENFPFAVMIKLVTSESNEPLRATNLGRF